MRIMTTKIDVLLASSSTPTKKFAMVTIRCYLVEFLLKPYISDVDECLFPLVCKKDEKCQNTVGSFKCTSDGSTPKCPPGFFFKESIQDCQDIDECVNGEHDCNRESQSCLNTKGNFTCVDKTVQGGCPAGFKKNPVSLACEGKPTINHPCDTITNVLL